MKDKSLKEKISIDHPKEKDSVTPGIGKKIQNTAKSMLLLKINVSFMFLLYDCR